jgi:2-polyprenyl-6-methoxyphenol hydroxylase-like FAD-dependent oxidoreductase
MRQVVILGAGMAGMACCRTLMRHGCRPLVVAPQEEVANRGETLSFRSRPYLETLEWSGLLDAATASESEGRYSVWGVAALRRDASHQEGMSGWHIDRRELESRMSKSLAADGVDRVIGEVRRLSRSPDKVVLELADGSSIESEFVVDCSGRASITSGPDSALRRLDKLIACYSVTCLDDDVEVAPATLVEAVASGWWYMSLMPGRRMLIGFFTDSDLLPPGLRRNPDVWDDMVSQAIVVSKRAASLGIDLATSAQLDFAPASTVTASKLVEPRIVRAGDAASALDPLGANGLASALWSGIQAAHGIAGLLTHDNTAALRYERQYLEGIASYLATQQAMYASERRFPDAPFWQRRSGAWLENR